MNHMGLSMTFRIERSRLLIVWPSHSYMFGQSACRLLHDLISRHAGHCLTWRDYHSAELCHSHEEERCKKLKDDARSHLEMLRSRGSAATTHEKKPLTRRVVFENASRMMDCMAAKFRMRRTLWTRS